MPPFIEDYLADVTLLDAVVITVFLAFGIWMAFKFITWIVKQFFPGLLAFARGIVGGAQIYGAVKDLPEFMERTEDELAAQSEKIREVHHEVTFNNGSSLKDSAIRTERRMVRVERHLGIDLGGE